MSENTTPDRSNKQDPHAATDPATAQSTPPTDSSRPTTPLPQQPPQWWTQVSTPAKKSAADPLLLIRLAWAILISLVLLITWGSGPDGEDWQEEVSTAQSTARLNNDITEGAPQQQVVNGWQAVDLAEIQIRQNTALLDSQGHTANLLLVLGLGIFGDMALRALNNQRQISRRSTAALEGQHVPPRA